MNTREKEIWVLVMDDEFYTPRCREMAELMNRRTDIRYDVVLTYSEAIKKGITGKYKGVIMDNKVPETEGELPTGKGGSMFASAMEENGIEVPILVRSWAPNLPESKLVIERITPCSWSLQKIENFLDFIVRKAV